MFVHEDNRRQLIEFVSGDFRVCKVLTAKEGCVVGDHYHRHKDEAFLLARGKAKLVVIGDTHWHDILPPLSWHVPRNTYHRFELAEGSMLVGVATAEFDEADEIPGKP